MHWIIIIFMLAIVASLGSGLIFLLKGKENSSSVAKALSWRIGLSLFLFLLIIAAYFLGWIHPHGIALE